MGEFGYFLNIDKPNGITSRAVVDRVCELSGTRRVGHAGTLDPLATGVLVVAVGTCTRLIPYVQELSKHYRGEFLLGVTSDTDDITGQIVQLPNPPVPSEKQIVQVLQRFTGEIEQYPPVYSAVKIGGKRAYQLARQGKSPKLKARPVRVHKLEVLRYEYPVLELDIVCSSGTYVRSLGRDIAQAMGTGAVMSRLIRLAIGHFTIQNAVRLEQLSPENLQQYAIPAEIAMQHLPRLELIPNETKRLAHGQTIKRSGAPMGRHAAFDAEGRLVAIVQIGKNGFIRVEKNLRPSS